MEEKLISKKELLIKYGISYGALYRWKRKGLIPDEWFIKKSTPTGQETFFPEKLINERIELIKSMKDDVSLDELANRLSGEELKNEFLIFKTSYGTKKYKFSEIEGIALLNKDGEEIDITDSVKNMLLKEDNNTKSRNFGIFKRRN